MLEDSYATASKGCADYGLKLIEAARANTNAAFDLSAKLLTVKSLCGGGRAVDRAICASSSRP